MLELKDLVGRIITHIDPCEKDSDTMRFLTDGYEWIFYHDQDCCEWVRVEDVIGDLSDLIGNPILLAEAVSREDPSLLDSLTWTFYKFATIKGSVTVRWIGESNGYYSEEVDLLVKETTES